MAAKKITYKSKKLQIQYQNLKNIYYLYRIPNDPKKSLPRKGKPGLLANTIIRKSLWAIMAFLGVPICGDPKLK